MDDERIERALRAGPPDEPSYKAGLQARIATADSAPTGTRPALNRAIGRVDVRTAPRPGLGGLHLAGPIAAALVLVIAAVWLRSPFSAGDTQTPEPGDLLARLRNAGAVRVAITSGPPQTLALGGAYIGFDVDVADAVTKQLGLRDEPVFLSTADIVAGVGAWDFGLPSRAVVQGETRTDTAAYYNWPTWLAVPADSTIGTVAELEGGTICVVVGTVGGDWLLGVTPSGVDVAVPAPDATAVERTSDAECIAAIVAGEADAFVTAALLDHELATRGVRIVGEDPVLSEGRAVVVRGTSSDVSSLVEAIDRALVALKQAGRLADLSRASFGGRDLTGNQR